VFALTFGASVADLIADTCENLTSDPIMFMLAKRHYGKLTVAKLGHEKLSVYDELYFSEVMSEYAKHVFAELDGNTLWYLSGYGVFAGGVAAVGAKAIAQNLGEAHLNRHSVQSDDFEQVRIKDLRLSRTYLFAAVLPALAFAFLGFYEPMKGVVRAVVNVMVTLPTTLCGITLLYHSALRFYGKARILSVIVFWIIIIVSAVFYEWGMLIIGFIGLADVIINIRRCLDWALN
ncbi:MAG: hypothetical protein K2N18_01025, partial [Clostridia bacterium]|nr:hypothetical protein [Clostridia bacterium]